MAINWLKKKAFGEKKINDSFDAHFHSTGPVLNITVNEIHVATLYRDKSGFCLVYLPAYETTNLAPFNPEDLAGETPEINKVYCSPELWQVFRDRIPSENRDDYVELKKKLNLSESDDVLVVLGKIGKVSIAKPWKLVLIKK